MEMYEDIFKLKNEIKRWFCKLITLITWCCRLINCQKSRKELVERAKKIQNKEMMMMKNMMMMMMTMIVMMMMMMMKMM